MTVLFCDLAGSTELSARFDPEDMRETIRGFQDCCAGVVARCDGYLAKYMDDGVLAYFGYPPGSTGHSVPSYYGDVTLDTVDVNDWPFRQWELLVKVSNGDPGFEHVRSDIKLRKVSPEGGMGGLMNYAMIVPAGILLILATLVAVPLRATSRAPLILSVLSLLGFAVFLR